MLLLALAILTASPVTPPASAPADDPSPLAQQFIYFPPHLFSDARQIAGRQCTLWTNADKLDDELLRRQLDEVCEYLAGLSITPTAGAELADATTTASRPAPRPIVAALYQTQQQYRALWTRVGVFYKGSVLGAGQAGGYSYRVFCATYVDEKTPEVIPPELAHELAHVWLWQRAEIANDGNWLTEAIASAMQYRFNPASANRKLWADHAAKGRYLPLRRLLDTKPMRADNYWQIGTLGELLLTTYADKLSRAAQAQRAGGSPTRIIADSLDTDWLTLERQWLEYVRSGQDPAGTQASN